MELDDGPWLLGVLTRGFNCLAVPMTVAGRCAGVKLIDSLHCRGICRDSNNIESTI